MYVHCACVLGSEKFVELLLNTSYDDLSVVINSSLHKLFNCARFHPPQAALGTNKTKLNNSKFCIIVIDVFE